MNFIDFLKSRMSRYLIPFIFLIFFFNTISSFGIPPNHQKKANEQNIALLDLNSNANVLFDTGKFEKRIFDKSAGIKDIRYYLDNSLNVVFKKYYSSIRNSLSQSNSSRPFITVLFSTDI